MQSFINLTLQLVAKSIPKGILTTDKHTVRFYIRKTSGSAAASRPNSHLLGAAAPKPPQLALRARGAPIPLTGPLQGAFGPLCVSWGRTRKHHSSRYALAVPGKLLKVEDLALEHSVCPRCDCSVEIKNRKKGSKLEPNPLP